MTNWYGDHVLPALMDRAMDRANLREIRVRVTTGLGGEVVEIGFGTGHNLASLSPAVTRVLAVEPSESSVHRARARVAASRVPVDVVGLDGQRIPLPDSSVDAALCTWTLCSIADPVAAVAEISRVLRPGGQLHFVEHGRAPDAKVRRWQARLNPLQRRFVGGCTLDRAIPALLRSGGLTITQLETYYLTGEPRALGYMYEGRAVRPAR